MSRSPGDAATAGQSPAVLAVDGGNSKTDVALVAADGTLLASARGPGVPGVSRLGETIGVLGATARLAADQAGLIPDGPGPRIARHLSACVANADLPEEERELDDALRAEGWCDTTHVANDTFAVLRAGLDGPGPHWGVAVTCGAGINCVGVAPDGRTSRFLALGPLTGDWGGGGDLGQEAVWWAIRAEDGRGPQTALREAIAAHFGESSMWDVAVGFHTGKFDWDAVRRLVPVLFQVAEGGDEVAANVVRRQAGEVCMMALAAMRRLGLGDQRHVGLAVAAVDRQHRGRSPCRRGVAGGAAHGRVAAAASGSPPAQGRYRAFSAISRSASWSASSYWPTSG